MRLRSNVQLFTQLTNNNKAIPRQLYISSNKTFVPRLRLRTAPRSSSVLSVLEKLHRTKTFLFRSSTAASQPHQFFTATALRPDRTQLSVLSGYHITSSQLKTNQAIPASLSTPFCWSITTLMWSFTALGSTPPATRSVHLISDARDPKPLQRNSWGRIFRREVG